MAAQIPLPDTESTNAAVFVVLRRMRVPLIVLIVIFSISVVGLSLIPGESAKGPWRMGLFDAFYFMAYTATTIGYGEIPQTFNDAQRIWVTLSIFVTVIGWAYAIGSLLALVQDQSFRRALALQRFRRQVTRMSDPFWLMAGHGQTGEQLGRWLDTLGRRFVVVDPAEERIEALDLGAYHSEVPGLMADARSPAVLADAGIRHPRCEGVLGLTDDDEANLAITMTAAVLRPELPVITRCSSPPIIHRMEAFGTPIVINPFDRFGDHFTVALRAPATEQLASWLTETPGDPLPVRAEVLPPGRWVICGYGRFGREISRDLRAVGLEVVAIDPQAGAHPARDVVVGDGTEPDVLHDAGIDRAIGFVAGTDNDITNLSLIATARRANPGVFVVARQNEPVNHELFDALGVDLLMVPSSVVAQDALAHIAAPLLRHFLQEAGQRDDAWAARMVDRLVARCGKGSPELWQLNLTPTEAPAIARQFGDHDVTVGDLLRNPQQRDDPVEAVCAMVSRGASTALEPADDWVLAPGDQLLMVGRPAARRTMEATLEVDTSASYVVTGEHEPASWIWRQLTRKG